ncbi:MAG: helix-turn-helix domain-containing protein [Syntrophobacteraceae bacterium]
MANPLQKVYGGIILGSKQFTREALQRVEINRVQTHEISRARSLLSNVSLQEVISACCEDYGVTREEIMRSSRGESRKTCIYLIKQHTCATNKEIAESFGTLSYSAVAKISQSVSKKMGVDKELRERVKRLQAKYSLFKA